jgi:adenosyl cobinamide kinase/adenosyl cobinamide phosphate guanylyltransferase
MHTEAARTGRPVLPEMVAEVIQHHEARRRTPWRTHVKTAQAWPAGHNGMAAAAKTAPASIDLDADGREI